MRLHVDTCFKSWSSIFSGRSGSYEKKSEAETRRKQETKRKLALARTFAQGPEGCDTLRKLKMLQAVKASYAYTRNVKFAMAVAFQALCSIKASVNGSKAFIADFAEVVSMPSAARKVLSQDALVLED